MKIQRLIAVPDRGIFASSTTGVVAKWWSDDEGYRYGSDCGYPIPWWVASGWSDGLVERPGPAVPLARNLAHPREPSPVRYAMETDRGRGGRSTIYADRSPSSLAQALPGLQQIASRRWRISAGSADGGGKIDRFLWEVDLEDGQAGN